jgi:hypothetical protein
MNISRQIIQITPPADSFSSCLTSSAVPSPRLEGFSESVEKAITDLRRERGLVSTATDLDRRFRRPQSAKGL